MYRGHTACDDGGSEVSNGGGVLLLQEQLLALKDYPLRLCALACELELEDVARIAAERCYTRTYTTAYVPEMKRITAAQHYRLMYFSLNGFSGDRALRFVSCIRQRQPSQSLYAILSSICTQTDLHPFQANAYADTIILSMDGIDFYVNRYIISMAAPTFFEHQQPMPGPSAASFPVYKLDEHSTVITILLTLIHPLPELQFSNMEALGAITEAAVKYNMPRAVEILKRRWMGLIHTASLRVYFTMMRYGWECDAEQAAIHASYDGKDEYAPEMEDVSSLAYRRFLLFRHHRRLAVVSRVSFLLANLNSPLDCRRNKDRWRQLYWNKAGEWPKNLDAFALQVMGDAPLHGWHGSCVRALVIVQSLDQFTEEGQAMANESAEIMLLGLVAFERDIKQVCETVRKST